MNDKGDMDLNTLNLLLFSVCGVLFGVDSDQIGDVSTFDGEQREDLFWFHKLLEYGDGEADYFSPTVVSIKAGGRHSFRVIIDKMQDIAEFNLNEIQQFPALMEPLTKRRGFWGILPRKGSMVLLIDFQLLLKNKQN